MYNKTNENIFKRTLIRVKTLKKEDFEERDNRIAQRETKGKEILFKRNFEGKELAKKCIKRERF